MIATPYMQMSYFEKKDFMAKVIILAESSDYFPHFKEFVDIAENSGMFINVKPASESHIHLLDLDNPIE